MFSTLLNIMHMNVGTISQQLRAAVPQRVRRQGGVIRSSIRGYAHRYDKANGASTKKTAVIIVDHGSRREEANTLLHRVVECFEKQSEMDVVEAAHMELAKPDIADALCEQTDAIHPTNGL